MPSKISYNEFLNRANAVHKGKYDYSEVDLSNGVHSPVKIICPEHGEFWQTPVSHMRGAKCPKCAIIDVHNKQRKTTESFKKDAIKIWGDRYDLSKVKYTGAKDKVCIICPKHGEFWMRPNDFLNGHGCPSCGGVKPLNTEEFKKRAIERFGDKYTYDNVVYKNLGTHVFVTCPQHGDFPISPRNFFNGYGCPKCNQSHLEKSVECFLKKEHVKYVYQYKPLWGGKYRFDFYLPDFKTIIECQGRQHFSSIEYFKGDDGFEYLKHNDKQKKLLCEENGINLLYLLYSKNVAIPNDLLDVYNVKNTFFTIEDLWDFIVNKKIKINENSLRNLIKEEIIKKINGFQLKKIQ